MLTRSLISIGSVWRLSGHGCATRKVMECTNATDLSAERNEPVSLPLNTTPALKAMAG
jgi:hypothetical protein